MKYVDELSELLKETRGLKPRPIATEPDQMRRVPVKIALYHPGAAEPFAVHDVSIILALQYTPPHSYTTAAGETVEVPERHAELVFGCRVPLSVPPVKS